MYFFVRSISEFDPRGPFYCRIIGLIVGFIRISLFRRYAVHPLCHYNHQNQNGHQEYRIQSEGNMLAENAENRRHQAGSDVSKGHLDADDSLA